MQGHLQQANIHLLYIRHGNLRRKVNSAEGQLHKQSFILDIN